MVDSLAAQAQGALLNRRLALAAGLLWLFELPRDLHFLQGAEQRLQIGLALKLATGWLGSLGLWLNSPTMAALLIAWCVQGSIMSMGEWAGQGPSLKIVFSLAWRAGLLLGWLAWRKDRS